MSLSNSSSKRTNQVFATAISLVASILVFVFPHSESQADYTSSNSGPIIFNDRVCNLGDPNNHSTSATAFEISTSEQLWEITDCVSNSATIYFVLGDDIDVSSAASAPTNSPIGYSTSGDISFSGVLDGKNKAITGLSISASAYGVGLFAYLHNATIINLTLAGDLFTSTPTATTSHSAGALAIRANGSLNLTSISNQARVEGNSFVGGLVGYVSNDVSIDSSRNAATISGSDHVGGFFGFVSNDLTIAFSNNTGDVFGDGEVGGLVGSVDGTAHVTDSQNTGSVTGRDIVGGLTGYSFNANFNSAFNAGSVSGDSEVGGFIGLVMNLDITDSSNAGPISGSDYVGGLAASSTNVTIGSSHNTGPISGSDYVGGLLGYAGGPLGYVITEVDIEASSNTGKVSGDSEVGGLVGSVNGSARITSSYNVGTISGSPYVGGLLGYSQHANINSSYNNGAVFGDSEVGGLIGIAANLEISFVYNAGAVSGDSGFDGLVGFANTVMTTSAYTSVPSSYAAISTVADLKRASTFVGFDFNDLWGFGACSDNEGFPILRVFGAVDDYFAYSCGLNSPQDSKQTDNPAPNYSGPIVSGVQSAPAGSQVVFAGRRLDEVTTAFVGGFQVGIVSALSESLTLNLPQSMVPGSYDLVLQSGFGRLTVQNGITVLAAPDTSSVVEVTNRKLTVGAFKGFIAIYTRGYEGQRLSARVAGKWLVVHEVAESWQGNHYSRTLRRTEAGYLIRVNLYIDGEFIRTEELTTR
jgi:hypothetical protein